MNNSEICIELRENPLFYVELWNNIFSVLSDLATIAAVIIAGVAGYIAYQQLLASRKQSATSLYKEYLQLCIDNPDFAEGKYSENNKREYLWFVSQILFTFEQVVIANRGDKQWLDTIENQLAIHKAHLTRSRTANSGEWEKELDKLIKKVITS
ncbi:hypothetical protein BS021_RS04025 [Vibrio parahaemolyticus]|nr:hypothetical protein [Vibrio parahaemolyticus]